MTFLLYAGFGGALFLVPIFLIQVHGYSATAATSALVPFAVVTFLMGRWAGGLVTRYGEKLPLMGSADREGRPWRVSHQGERQEGWGRCRDRPGRGPCLPQCVPFRDVRLGGDGGHERDRGCPCDSREGRQRARKVRSSQRWVGNF